MARYSLIVPKVPLNTSQSINQSIYQPTQPTNKLNYLLM